MRSGADSILSPNSSPTPIARAPYLNNGRSSSASWPGVSRPATRAAARLAMGVIERALATAPIRAEKSSPRGFMGQGA